MAASKKPKYPVSRAKQSKSFKDNQVTTQVYSTNPTVNIHIKGDFPEEIISDIQNAIDDVLNHWGR
ncbi:MAG: hypothetical protein AAGB30_11055 [Pedobacter sp.]|nr:hypothetical protein [Pedobacter sp.]